MSSIQFNALLLMSSLWTGSATSDTDRGTFLHVTDFHWDFSYNGSDWSCNGDVGIHGEYGDYWCDAPWRLIQSCVQAMRNATPTPDFILWTGDNILHTEDENLSLEKNDELIQNLTWLFKDYFPNSPTYATFGNHDYFPNGQFPPHNNEVYNRTYNHWKGWINSKNYVDQEANFRKGAYYTIKDRNGLRIMALNTNFYYTSDKITASETDPAGQFEWMEKVFNISRNKGEKILVTGHVPPGIHSTHGTRSMYEHYNKKFNEIVRKYNDVIVGMHFGHEHTDNIRLYRSHDEALVALYLAPSVTPWRTKQGPPHNPGFRMIHYNRTNGNHLDMVQYYINLQESNRISNAKWQVEYIATRDMNIPDISPRSLDNFVSKTKDPNSKEFKDYFKWRTVSVNHPEAPTCDKSCHIRIICNFEHLELKEFNQCSENYLTSGSNPLYFHSTVTSALITFMFAYFLYAKMHG